MVRTVGLAGGGFLLAYSILSIATGQRLSVLGDLAQLVLPLAYAALTLWLARQSRAQARIFWTLHGAHGVLWATGQAVWTYYAASGGVVSVVAPSDGIFFASTIPLAAALYGRPDRHRLRWLFDIVLLDVLLIALFSAFAYGYFVVSIASTDSPDRFYDASLAQLLNARNLVLALWAGGLWYTAISPAWRRVLGIHAIGLGLAFVGGLLFDIVDRSGAYSSGGLWDMIWMIPFAAMSLAAASAYDQKLFEPSEMAPPLTRLPVVSLIAVSLLVAVPVIDEVARRMSNVSAATELLRMRLALTMMIPFGVVVVLRDYLSRRALLRVVQDIASAREQLAQTEKLAAVGQLVSGVAHELNNPLQGVLGYAELMLASRSASPDRDELLAIRDNANRAAGIVRNLVRFAGPVTSARGWQHINQIVRKAVASREAELSAAGIDLHADLADGLPMIYVDPAKLEDVLVNLIHNAAKAIAARRAGTGIRSAVPAKARGEITLTTRGQGKPDRIFVDVADNGGGLRAEDLPRVFDPFFTTSEVGQGTGLGLSVCYGTVREHGGRITACNRSSGGAVFSVELPVTAESKAATGAVAGTPRPAEAPPDPSYTVIPPDEAPVRPSGPGRVLVVDDEESNAALVRRALTVAGYDVQSTTVSGSALVMIERDVYDVVICDVKMPDVSGPELYDRVCQMRPELARRFVFVTGDIDGDDTREFLDRSRCSYFMKPFNLERLTAAVRSLTGARAPDTIG